MTFDVEWTLQAENGLASLWLSAANREAIVVAADTIDRLLETDPLNEGESRDDRMRILFESPLCVIYSVSEEIQTVVVLSCGPSR